MLRLLIVLCLLPVFVCAQVKDSIPIDNKYLEDQFSAAVWYNLLQEKPENVIQRNLSYGLGLNFIKDIPFNQRRNFGVGLGLGVSVNSYYSNLVATDNGDSFISYRIATSEDAIKRSKIGTYGINLPFEVRWRSSRADTYRFWRVYAGVKTAYIFASNSKLVTDSIKTSLHNPNIEQWQYGLSLSVGYNTWNLHLYYSLSNLLDENALLNNNPINIKPLRVGLIFYIL